MTRKTHEPKVWGPNQCSELPCHAPPGQQTDSAQEKCGLVVDSQTVPSDPENSSTPDLFCLDQGHSSLEPELTKASPSYTLSKAQGEGK